jgi:hypothetical protein
VICATLHGVHVYVDCENRLLPWPQYLGEPAQYSLLNQFQGIAITSAAIGTPALVIRQRDQEGATVVVNADVVTARGNFAVLEQKCRDRRFTLLGTVGVFYRTMLRELERSSVVTLHAAALYKPKQHEVVVILGSSGAGKTPCMLAGLAAGYQLFGTDHVHLSVVSGRAALLKGGVRDNVYPATLMAFPSLAHVPEPVRANTKQCVDLSQWQTDADRIIDPVVQFVAPRSSTSHDGGSRPSRGMHALQSRLYANATEKLAEYVALYDGTVEMAPVNNQALSVRRMELLRSWLSVARIRGFEGVCEPTEAEREVLLPWAPV